MGYKNTAKIRVDLSDLGTDNQENPFFAEIQNPKLLTWPQKMEAAKFAVPKDKVLTPEETAEMTKGMKEYVFGFIKSWNLISLVDEQPVKLESPAALDLVPSEVVERIMAEFGKQEEEQKN